ncbi:hypothetical protein B0H16DRAFT_1810756 [Mycena metata]|uniref:Uncharacterized protein n=1 Tax=Mycena metata TaxID=1033252 RepID=A0AAD7H6N5_9AGAR|nr:hypothetical protein B0H16DRAFT_1810756 [Mycena metata]
MPPEVPAGPNINDIKHEFHPHSGRPLQEESLEDYLRTESLRPRPPPTEEKPYAPGFRTRLDFEVAHFAQENMLNKKATNELISLIRRCAANPEEFTIANHADMNRQWDQASKKCTEDPRLADFFPWTAQAYWGIQSKLPDHKDAKLCPYIIYADKSKLSSFGTEKAYPVIARLGNIVVGIRNGNEWGGGQVVGSLPVVKDDTAESGKPGYVNFKNAVWHSAFYKLLESIVAHSKTGIWTQCGDGQQRWLFPVILILAADYEEACSSVMALIRGLRGLYPCPICFVKAEQQSDLAVTSDLRTAQHAQAAIEKARTLNAERSEESLKSLGLRNVDNVFWNVAHSDAHRAISFDRLHSHQSGLWGDHLFLVLKFHIERLGARQLAKLDRHMPRWRNLNHFQTVSNLSFNDGSKHEDISKIMIYAVHNILTDRLGLLLLRCVRGYMELNMYVGLELHTTKTIAAGRRQLEKFGELMKEYIAACEGTEFEDKNWNFIKMHLHKHVFDDIEQKGVTKNFGTKIDEAMHGPARAAYLRQTNFKNVTPQILRSLHRRMVGKYILEQLDDLDALWEDEDSDEPVDLDNIDPLDLEEFGNVVVGAKHTVVSFSALETAMKRDLAFANFRIRFSDFLSEFLPAYGHALPGGKRVRFTPEQEITPYRYLKVFFQSLDDWKDEKDYLRCNPSFHNHERYDAALVKTTTGTIFVRLVFVFTWTSEGKTYPFALVQPLDVGIGQRSAKDKALHFYRVREKPRHRCEFISVHSIIRGALLAPDFDKKGDYLAIDGVDSDMFLRLMELYPNYTT